MSAPAYVCSPWRVPRRAPRRACGANSPTSPLLIPLAPRRARLAPRRGPCAAGGALSRAALGRFGGGCARCRSRRAARGNAARAPAREPALKMYAFACPVRRGVACLNRAPPARPPRSHVHAHVQKHVAGARAGWLPLLPQPRAHTLSFSVPNTDASRSAIAWAVPRGARGCHWGYTLFHGVVKAAMRTRLVVLAGIPIGNVAFVSSRLAGFSSKATSPSLEV